MPVNTAPTSTPSRGLLNAVRMLANSGISCSGLTACFISSIPYIKMAKPMRIRPMSRRFCFLEAIMSKMPISATNGEKFSGFSSFTHTFPLSIPLRESIQAVSVVPMLLPMMTPMVCPSSMTPEFTSPTSITVTAEED
ncbi:hypothetical protein SDC9_207750 [bioreactor metagenome]|uniref:Uncharacterized protein n=1 Tax=bioreactor metagenome TaxID=1076179 RepID=A0A645J9F4_9ZZZZ